LLRYATRAWGSRSNRPLYELALSGKLSLKSERILLQAFGIDEDRAPLFSEYKAIAGSLKKLLSNGLLKGCQPSPHGRLGLAQRPGGRTECAVTRDGKKYTNVAPFHITTIVSSPSAQWENPVQTMLHDHHSISCMSIDVALVIRSKPVVLSTQPLLQISRL